MRFFAGKWVIGAAALVAVVTIPDPVSAFFWSGPGCFVANMLGMGSAGGLHFSVGGSAFGSGPGYGHHTGYPPPPRVFHPRLPPAPLMSPTHYAPFEPPHRPQHIIEGNTWRSQTTDRQPFASGRGATAPGNLWRQGH